MNKTTAQPIILAEWSEPLYGIKVYISPYLTKVVARKRTWRERLFSLPWEPWVGEVDETVPSEDIQVIEPSPLFAGRLRQGPHQIFIVHPNMESMLRQRLEEANRELENYRATH